MAFRFLQEEVSAGAAKVFSVTELRPVEGSLQETGVVFRWSAQDHAIPRNGWQFGLVQRTVREDYPGAEEPVEQVLGWNYSAFTVSGCWDDRYGGHNFALDTWRNFEDLVKRGNPVRVQFEQVAAVGIITGVNFHYRRADLIEYQFTVSPHYREQGESVRVEAPGTQGRLVVDPKTAVQEVRKHTEELQAAQADATAENLSQVQAVLADDTFRDMTAELDTLQGYIDAADHVVNQEILEASNAVNAMARGAQIMASVISSAQTILTNLAEVKSDAALGVQTASSILDFEVWRRGLTAQARALILGADAAREDFIRRSEPSIKRLHRGRQGESLYAISNLYYGTPFRWRQIAETNGLTALVLAGGELLAIPDVV